MFSEEPKPIKKPTENHRVERPVQTGFSSPATHYNEPRIDLNKVLVSNTEGTFYIRVTDDSFQDFNIEEKDVLIVDRSIEAQNNQLALVTLDGSFIVHRINHKNLVEINVWGVITYIIKSVK